MVDIACDIQKEKAYSSEDEDGKDCSGSSKHSSIVFVGAFVKRTIKMLIS